MIVLSLPRCSCAARACGTANQFICLWSGHETLKFQTFWYRKYSTHRHLVPETVRTTTHIGFYMNLTRLPSTIKYCDLRALSAVETSFLGNSSLPCCIWIVNLSVTMLMCRSLMACHSMRSGGYEPMMAWCSYLFPFGVVVGYIPSSAV